MSHTITWTIRSTTCEEGHALCMGGGIEGHAECGADEQAPCRNEVDSDTYDHCLAVEWWDHEGEGLQYYYRGPDAPLRDGPVDVEWTGDVWVWGYPEAESS